MTNTEKTKFLAIYNEAHREGIKAGIGCTPVPMGVTDGDVSWIIDEGCCGFAWVWFPANTAWARWCKERKISGRGYPSGACIWVSEFGQSIDRKERYAQAFAKVLQKYNITAYAQSRLD